MKKTLFNLRSAYGQLLILVLVFREVRQALLSEQDALARTALLGYEMNLTHHFANTGSPTPTLSVFDESFHQISPQQVRRMAIFDGDYHLLASHGGYDNDTLLANDDLLRVMHKNQGNFERHKSTYGTSYGKQMMFYGMPYYVVVEMDDEPLTITGYRVVLALAITGLTTLLLLLLILNIYSKRWIAPIYEMRLFLQKLNSKPMPMRPNRIYSMP